jgi:hypothetical protein
MSRPANLLRFQNANSRTRIFNGLHQRAQGLFQRDGYQLFRAGAIHRNPRFIPDGEQCRLIRDRFIRIILRLYVDDFTSQ